MLLNATGILSRNYTVGRKLGEGLALHDCLPEGKVVEGVSSAEALASLSLKLNVELPICSSVLRILREELRPEEALSILLEREVPEDEWK